jgi:hypothetical protein
VSTDPSSDVCVANSFRDEVSFESVVDGGGVVAVMSGSRLYIVSCNLRKMPVASCIGMYELCMYYLCRMYFEEAVMLEDGLLEELVVVVDV